MTCSAARPTATTARASSGRSRSLFEAGVVLRARKITGDDDDSTVKLRPLARDEIDPSWLDVDGMKCEIDRLLDRETPSCSLTVVQDAGEIDDVDLPLATEQETKTRRALELLSANAP